MVSLSELSKSLVGHKASVAEQQAKITRTKNFQTLSKSLAVPARLISGGAPQISGQTTNRQPTRGEIIGSPGFNVLNQIQNLFSGKNTSVIPSSVAPIGSPITSHGGSFFFPSVINSLKPTAPSTSNQWTPSQASTLLIAIGANEAPIGFDEAIQRHADKLNQSNPPGTSQPFFESLKEGFKQIPKEVLLGAAVLGAFLLLRR